MEKRPKPKTEKPQLQHEVRRPKEEPTSEPDEWELRSEVPGSGETNTEAVPDKKL